MQLYNAGYFQDRLLTLMKKAFYEPNIKLLKGRYERNCKLLARYPYLFRKDFLPFDELPLVFSPTMTTTVMCRSIRQAGHSATL